MFGYSEKKIKGRKRKFGLVRKKKKKVGTENFGTLVISWDLKFIVSDWLTKSGFNFFFK